MGGVITTFVLIFGSVAVIYNAILRIINPVEINYDGMIVFAIVGAVVNLAAAYFTREGDSINQKAVNLHMLEDVLGWVIVLVGAIIMRFTDIKIIDPIMSIGVAIFIFINAVNNLKEIVNLFMERLPAHLRIDEIKAHICEIEGVLGVHHIHIWSMDGQSNYATMHVICAGEHSEIKRRIREELKEHGISHVTLELEDEGEECGEEHCHVEHSGAGHHHHHHHHHHGHHHH